MIDLAEIERNAVTSCRRETPDDLSADVFALIAEVKRLREALQSIRSEPCASRLVSGRPCQAELCASCKARKALS